jgi:hypothetical protein
VEEVHTIINDWEDDWKNPSTSQGPPRRTRTKDKVRRKRLWAEQMVQTRNREK